MKQLPILNKKEEDFLSNLIQLINEHSINKHGGSVIFRMRETFYFSGDEKKMLDEIASKITKA